MKKQDREVISENFTKIDKRYNVLIQFLCDEVLTGTQSHKLIDELNLKEIGKNR